MWLRLKDQSPSPGPESETDPYPESETGLVPEDGTGPGQDPGPEGERGLAPEDETGPGPGPEGEIGLGPEDETGPGLEDEIGLGPEDATDPERETGNATTEDAIPATAMTVGVTTGVGVMTGGPIETLSQTTGGEVAPSPLRQTLGRRQVKSPRSRRRRRRLTRS